MAVRIAPRSTTLRVSDARVRRPPHTRPLAMSSPSHARSGPPDDGRPADPSARELRAEVAARALAGARGRLRGRRGGDRRRRRGDPHGHARPRARGRGCRAAGRLAPPRQARVAASRSAASGAWAPTSDTALLTSCGPSSTSGPRGATWLLEQPRPGGARDRRADPRGALREVPGSGPSRIGAGRALMGGAARAPRAAAVPGRARRPGRGAARIERAFGPEAIELLRADPYALDRGRRRRLRHRRRARAGARHPDRRARSASTPGSCTRCSRPSATALPAPARRARQPRRGGCSAPTSAAASTNWSRAGRLVADGDRVADPAMDGLERRLARRVRELADDGRRCCDLDDAERPTDGEFAPTDAQWAVVDAVLGAAARDPHRRPGHRQDGDDARARGPRCARAGGPCASARRRARRRGGWTRRRARRRRRSTACSSGSRARASRAARTTRSTGADVLVVDEASMLDLRLADALLGAVGPRTHVLLVGDVDQLPPVGAGRSRGPDRSGAVPTVRLTEIFRQAARSLIVRAAHAINARRAAARPQPGEDDVRDFFFVERDGPDAMLRRGRRARRRAPARATTASTRVATCRCSRRCTAGRSGIDALNDRAAGAAATPTARRSRERRCASATA